MGVANFRTLTRHDYLRKLFHRFVLTNSPYWRHCLTDYDMSGDHLNYGPGLIYVVAVNVDKKFSLFVCVSELHWAELWTNLHYELMVDMPRSGVGLKSETIYYGISDDRGILLSLKQECGKTQHQTTILESIIIIIESQT